MYFTEGELRLMNRGSSGKPSLNDLERLHKQLEEFNHLSLPSIPFQFRSKLPKESGIYIVYLDSQVLYVGQAKNIQDRWRDHNISDKLALANDLPADPNLRIGWIEVSKNLTSFAEIYLIGLLHPVLNIVHRDTSF